MPYAPTPITERLARRVDKRGPEECWPWLGAVAGGSAPEKRYGVIGAGGKHGTNRYVHRVAYEAVHGPIPAGQTIDHLCRNRLCVNPAHLEVVTQRENTRRSPSCKLTVALAGEIREAVRADGRFGGQARVARRYGVHPSIVSRIMAGKAWAA